MLESEPQSLVPPLRSVEIMTRAWFLILDKFPILLFALLVHAVRNIILLGLVLLCTVTSPASPAILISCAIVLGTLSYLELPTMCLEMVRGRPIRVFRQFSLITNLRWIAATIMFAVLCSIGTVALIVPGLLFGLMFGYYGFAIADGARPLQALKLSARIFRLAVAPTVVTWLALVLPLFISISPIFTGIGIPLDLELTMVGALIYSIKKLEVESKDAARSKWIG
jgi:hypothetical protein